MLVAILISHHVAASLLLLGDRAVDGSHWQKIVVFTWFRYAVAMVALHIGLAFTVWAAPWRHYLPKRADWWRFILVGLTHVLLALLTHYKAATMLPTKVPIIWELFLPVFVFAIGAAIGIEEVTWLGIPTALKLLGLILAITGAVLSVAYGELPNYAAAPYRYGLGNFLMLLSVIGFAVCFVLQKALLSNDNHAVYVSCWSCTSCMVVLTCCVAPDLAKAETWKMSAGHLGMVLYGGLVATAFGWFLITWAMKFASPAFIVALDPMKPLVLAMCAWLGCKDTPNSGIIDGAPLVISGVVFLVWGRASELRMATTSMTSEPEAEEQRQELNSDLVPPRSSGRSRGNSIASGGAGGSGISRPTFPGGCVLLAILISHQAAAGLFVVGKWATSGDHWNKPVIFTWMRYFVAIIVMHTGLVFMVWAAPWRNYFPKREDLWRFALAGCCNALMGNFMQYLAHPDLPGYCADLWMALLPIFVWVIGVGAGVEDVTWLGSSSAIKVVGVTLAIVSSAVSAVLGQQGYDATKAPTYRYFAGNSLMFLSTCGYGMWYVMQKVLLNRGYTAVQTAAWTTTFGLIAMTPFCIKDVVKPTSWKLSGSQIGILLYGGAMPTALGGMLSCWAMKWGGAAFVCAFDPLKPNIFALIGWLVLQDRPSKATLIALPLVIFGLFLLVLGRSKELRAATAELEAARRTAVEDRPSSRRPNLMSLQRLHSDPSPTF